jgi:BirA family biotin operon repressor/biotin-[acetyl-CoA-carboxylase] ligase
VAESIPERIRQMFNFQFGDTLPIFSKPHFQWGLKTDYVGRRFIYRPVTESTMDDTRRMLERFNLQNGAVVLAETQTAGRGRAGRSWVSPPDVNLHFTVLLYPEMSQLRPLAYVTPLAVALAVEEVAHAAGKELAAGLKWPNDVFLGEKKAAGVLIETSEIADRLVALVGVGVNVNLEVSDYPEIRDIATSVKEAIGVKVAREEVLAAFCNHFESLYEEAKSGSRRPFEAWRARLITLGREVVAHGLAGAPRGIAVDVEEDGALVLQLADGRRLRVEAGDVTPPE